MTQNFYSPSFAIYFLASIQATGLKEKCISIFPDMLGKEKEYQSTLDKRLKKMKITALNMALVFAVLGTFQACSVPKKEPGIPIYIEIEEMDASLNKCFSSKLYNTWAQPNDVLTHPLSESFKGTKPTDKHVFKSYELFDLDKDQPGTIKIIFSADAPGGDTANTFFQLRKFELEKEGIWSENLNIGHFRVQDRPNDHINPGIIDEEELCSMMVKFAIKASFK